MTLYNGCKFSGLFIGVSSDKSLQSQKMLPAFVDVSAEIEDKQFTVEVPISSDRRIISKMQKSHLPEDATGDSCRGDEKHYLHEINKRYIKYYLRAWAVC